MTNKNEEKAKKIVLSKPFNNASSQDYAYKCVMEMAKLKDEKFRELVKSYIEMAYDSGQPANLLEDLLKEI